MTIAEALTAATVRLAPVSDSPRLDAELLMAQLLGKSRGALYGGLRDPFDERVRPQFENWIVRRADGEPVAYLLGHKEFWSLDLQVTPDVLVPRPETELLVEWSLQLLAEGSQRIADLGTGSGALALALARERPQAEVTATDCSESALSVAQDNAGRNALSNVQFAQGHWCAALQGRYDLIVSNPPYILDGDPHLLQLRHEPRQALTDCADGLGCLREIIAGAPAHLSPRAWLLVEHGWDQAAAVRDLFAAAGFVDVETRRDLAGLERASGGHYP